jgi:CubicO group peptidase (beta-lactamase class C family)
MVATALARLGAAGRLTLDDPAAAHVPELEQTDWAQRAALRDLLANRARVPLSVKLEFSDFEGEDDSVLSRFAAAVATGEPAARFWSYTNAGWCLLGRALESVTGLTWEDAMQATVFEPLAMGQTTFATRDAAEPRASGHEMTGGGPVPVERWMPRALGPAGTTLLSTVDDMLRFAQAQLDDPNLAALRTTHAEVRIYPWLDAWCLGWARFDWDGGPVWGWDGLISGDRAVLRMSPGRRSALVLLTNGSTGRALYRSLFPELVETYFGVVMPPLRLQPSREGVGDLSRFAGVYAWPDERFSVTASDGALVIASDRTRVEAFPLDACTVLVDAADPDTPTMTFGAFDDLGRPHVLYRMLWGLPRV